MHKLFTFLAALLAVGNLNAQPALTVYNENFGVVRDRVPLDLASGINAVSYSGVSAQLEPESVILRDPSGAVALSVVEQSYRADPIDQMRLLQMFEGQTIRFLKVVEGREVIEAGKIIRAPAQMVTQNQYGQRQSKRLEPIIEIDGELQTRLPGVPLFPSLGDDSVLQPTLSWKLFVDQPAALDAQLSYLTNGLSWKSDYNLVLPEKGDTVSFTGWVSIENRSGKTFEDAKIKLIAGDVNKVEPQPHLRREKVYAMALSDQVAPPAVEQKKFDEFHLYRLPLPTTLRDQETKQLEFVRAAAVPTRKRYVYDGAQLPGNWRSFGRVNHNQSYGQNAQPDVAIYREFDNRDDHGLGLPLPAGRMRFYRLDDDGQLEFTGENRIDHSPKNETIRVFLGNAFDLIGERRRSDYYKHPSRDLIRETFEIEIRNRSEEVVTVQVVEHLYRWSNWQVDKASHSFAKRDAQTIEFPVTVKPDGSQTVRYTVEYRW